MKASFSSMTESQRHGWDIIPTDPHLFDMDWKKKNLDGWKTASQKVFYWTGKVRPFIENSKIWMDGLQSVKQIAIIIFFVLQIWERLLNLIQKDTEICIDKTFKSAQENFPCDKKNVIPIQFTSSTLFMLPSFTDRVAERSTTGG